MMDAIISVCVLIVLLAGAVFVSGTVPVDYEPLHPESQQLNCINDIPLMDDQEKAEARESGYAAYDMFGMHYVDASLPKEYYQE